MHRRPLQPHLAACSIILLGLTGGSSRAAVDQHSSDQAGTTTALTEHPLRALSADTKAHLRVQVLNQILERELLSEAEKEISADAVAAYHRQHEHHFRQPEAVSIWRLLVASETQARELLNEIQRSPDSVRTWGTLVRQHSLDKATHFRRGALGYVWPDGNTDVPQVRVAPALFEAAKSAKDGELVPHPVREGQYWALVWRRDTRPANVRPLIQVQTVIRQQLSLSLARSKHVELTTRLRSSYLSDYHPERMDSFSPGPEAFAPARRPPVAAQPAARSPVPQQTDLGER